MDLWWEIQLPRLKVSLQVMGSKLELNLSSMTAVTEVYTLGISSWVWTHLLLFVSIVFKLY